MTSEQPNEADIFNSTRRIESPDERNVFLTDACGDDSGLRQRVEKLLAAFAEAYLNGLIGTCGFQFQLDISRPCFRLW